MDVVLSILEDLHLVAFAIGRRGGLEHFSVDLVHFLLQLLDSIVDGFLLFGLGLFGREA